MTEVKPKRRWWLLYLAAILCAGIGVAPPADAAAHWTVARLVAHAGHSAAACQVAPHWGPKQNRCAILVAFRREPRLGREAVKIAGCETGGTWDETMVDGPYVGLGNFDRRTWASLPRWLSRHSPFDPPWMARAMRYLRLTDGDWHQFPYCSTHAL